MMKTAQNKPQPPNLCQGPTRGCGVENTTWDLFEVGKGHVIKKLWH
jgi:hypothetical protein